MDLSPIQPVKYQSYLQEWFDHYPEDIRVCHFCNDKIKDEDYIIIHQKGLYEFRSHKKCLTARRFVSYQLQKWWSKDCFPNPHTLRPIKRKL